MIRLLLNIVAAAAGVALGCLFFTWDALPEWVSALGLVFWGGSGTLLLLLIFRKPDDEVMTGADVVWPFLAGLFSPITTYVLIHESEEK